MPVLRGEYCLCFTCLAFLGLVLEGFLGGTQSFDIPVRRPVVLQAPLGVFIGGGRSQGCHGYLALAGGPPLSPLAPSSTLIYWR